MPQIHIPEMLLREIEKTIAPSASAEEFVVQAVQEELSLEQQKNEFHRISSRTRAAMIQKGLSEEEILADFVSVRDKLSE